ncbi:MAG TPA: hypothetical protein VGS21_00325 [Acidimicrobiales bacterium]|nr:hypothetical protein [Acidimicrobiales bacterium]
MIWPESPRDPAYAAWFQELDAWTEYWDVYHPETQGRYYFGDGAGRDGLLSRYLPRGGRPAPFQAWVSHSLGHSPASGAAEAAHHAQHTQHAEHAQHAQHAQHAERFAAAVRAEEVASAVLEVDDLVAKLFVEHFGDAADPGTAADYLDGVLRFAVDVLPPEPARQALVSRTDPRWRTAGRHTLDGDIMWFAWAVHLAAAEVLDAGPSNSPRRALMMAGVAAGCPANFAWRGHRRTRPEYRPDEETASLLRSKALCWATDFEAAHTEVRELFRIREWGYG